MARLPWSRLWLVPSMPSLGCSRYSQEQGPFISNILAGLDFEYNSFIEAFTAKTEPQTLNDLYSQLLTCDTLSLTVAATVTE
jgi:hypothetical protein